jgi:hypothetical protein
MYHAFNKETYFSDLMFTFLTTDKRLYAHRVILTCRAPKLLDILCTDDVTIANKIADLTIENKHSTSSDTAKTEIQLTYIRYEVLRILLAFVYSDFVVDEKEWATLTPEMMQDLIELAAKCKMDRLTLMVGNRLTKKIVGLDHPDYTLKDAFNNQLYHDKKFIIEGT